MSLTTPLRRTKRLSVEEEHRSVLTLSLVANTEKNVSVTETSTLDVRVID